MAASKVVIVGAGPGGLAAGMLLGKAGLDVTLLERLPGVGGRSRTLAAEGFRFDTGPTFFLYPRILKEIFAACGYQLEDEIELTRLDTQYRLIFGDDTAIEVTRDRDQLRREINRIAPEDGEALPQFLAENRAKMQAFIPILQRPFPSVADFMRPDVLRALPLLRPWSSVDQDLKRCFKDPRIRLAFSFQSKYVGMSPFQCPSLFTILSFMEHEHGVFHPKGGCGAVMNSRPLILRRMARSTMAAAWSRSPSSVWASSWALLSLMPASFSGLWMAHPGMRWAVCGFSVAPCAPGALPAECRPVGHPPAVLRCVPCACPGPAPIRPGAPGHPWSACWPWSGSGS